LHYVYHFAKIRDVDNPAKQPFQAAVRFSIDVGQSAGSASIAQVQANKRLVIEYISCEMILPVNNLAGEFLIATVLGAPPPISHRLFFNPLTNGAQGLSQLVRFYADPQTSVEIEVLREGATTLAVTVDAAISGHLVDVL
jgi:hypothetical protein